MPRALLLLLLAACMAGVAAEPVTLTTEEPVDAVNATDSDDAPVTAAEEAAEPDLADLVSKATENAKTEEQKAVEAAAARLETVGNISAVAKEQDVANELKVVDEMGLNITGDVADPEYRAELVRNATLLKLNESGLNESMVNASRAAAAANASTIVHMTLAMGIDEFNSKREQFTQNMSTILHLKGCCTLRITAKAVTSAAFLEVGTELRAVEKTELSVQIDGPGAASAGQGIEDLVRSGSPSLKALGIELNTVRVTVTEKDESADALAADVEEEEDRARAEADAAAEAARLVTPVSQAPADPDKADMRSNTQQAETNRIEHLRWRYKEIEDRAKWINHPTGGWRPIQANSSREVGKHVDHNRTHPRKNATARNESNDPRRNASFEDDGSDDPFAADESGFTAPDWVNPNAGEPAPPTPEVKELGPVFYNDTVTNNSKTEEEEAAEVMAKRNATLQGIMGVGNSSSLPSLRSMTLKMNAFGDDSQMGLALVEMEQHNAELTALEFRLLFTGANATATEAGKAQLASVVKTKIIAALREVNHIIAMHKGASARPLSLKEIRAVLSTLKHMLRIVQKSKKLGILKSRPSLQRALNQKEQEDAADAREAAEAARISGVEQQKKAEKAQQSVIPGDAEVRCPSTREICELNVPCRGTCPCPTCAVGGDAPTATESDGTVQQGSVHTDATQQRDEVPMTNAIAPQRHSMRP